MLKIAIGQFMQESHSFTPMDCSWEQFHAGHIYRGEDILKRITIGNQVEVAGAINVASTQPGQVCRHRTLVGLQRGVIRIYSVRRF